MKSRSCSARSQQTEVLQTRPAEAGPQRIALAPPHSGIEAVDRAARLQGPGPWATGPVAPLPPALRNRIEALSGLTMDDVRVHYRSAEPAQFEAAAFARGREIHLGPGAERHLPHEAWHVVQQKQGRVPTSHSHPGAPVNDDARLEGEADRMGLAATKPEGRVDPGSLRASPAAAPATSPVQRWRIKQINPMNTGTASTTYATTIGKLWRRNVEGVAKKTTRQGELANASVLNLGLETKYDVITGEEKAAKDPRMLARQVASWKVAKALGLQNILSHERYAEQGSDLYGVSELFQGGKSIQDMADIAKPHNQPHPQARRDLFTLLTEPAVQKQLSDLQLLDAITGQTDRHMGNVMIHPNSGQVKGIDNDQAFPANNLAVGMTPLKWLERNSVNSFAKSETGDLEFTQDKVDYHTAKRILKTSDRTLIKAMKTGRRDHEQLTKEERAAALDRLHAVQGRLLALKQNQQLINQPGTNLAWGSDTFEASLGSGSGGHLNDGKDSGRNIVWRSMLSLFGSNQIRQPGFLQRQPNETHPQFLQRLRHVIG